MLPDMDQGRDASSSDRCSTGRQELSWYTRKPSLRPPPEGLDGQRPRCRLVPRPFASSSKHIENRTRPLTKGGSFRRRNNRPGRVGADADEKDSCTAQDASLLFPQAPPFEAFDYSIDFADAFLLNETDTRIGETLQIP